MLRSIVWLAAVSFCAAAGTQRLPQKTSVGSKLKEQPVPVVFEPNWGQIDGSVRFVGRGRNHTLFLREKEVVMSVASGAVHMRLVGANPNARAEGMEPLPGVSNYLLGKDPARWRTGIPHFAKVRYRDVYPGIDLVFYTNQRDLEYDFVVAPGADASRIQLAYQGMDRIRKAANGDLLFDVAGAQIRQRKPTVYQRDGAGRTEVAASYNINGGNVQIALAAHDRARALVIDPAVEYTTYLAGEGYDFGAAIAVDAGGNSYVAGGTNSSTLPVGEAAVQKRAGGATDAYLAKFSQFGDLVFITYLGGSETDAANGIALDPTGNIYLSGFTTSGDFPARNGFQPTFGGEMDAFVAKVSPTGTALIYSTYLGGSGEDYGNGIAVDAQGSAYITGWTVSRDLPVRNAFQSGPAGGGSDAFVTKLSPTGSGIVYSTYVGGNGQDLGVGITLDASGNAYVTGGTTSSLFPTANAFQSRNGGGFDVFVFKLAAAGNALVYSTLAGGDKEDLGYRIAVDAANSAYVTGYTLSANFPVRNAFQPALGGATDAFVFKLSPAGDSLLYSTYLGGSADDLGQGSIAVDAAGSAYVSGGTASPNFPTRNAAQPTYGGGASDAFVVRLAPAGNALLYSTFIGGREEDRAYGLALDSRNAVYITGRSSSPDLPAATNALRVDTGRFDMFLARLAPDSSVSLVIASPPALTFNASGSSPSALTVALSSSGSPATFSISTAVQSGGGWLSAATNPTSLTPAILTVRVNPAGLAEGVYQGTVTVNVSGAVSAPVIIPVTLNVIAPPVITSIAPASLTVNAADTRITILGSGFRNDSTVAINGVAISTSFLNANTLQAVVPLNQFASAGSLQVSVVNAGVSSNIFSLPVAGTGPTFSAASIVNAATFAGGPVSPGELITIFGSLLGPAQLAQAGAGSSDVFPSILAETRVLFDGVAAPLVYVQAGQVTAVVPYSMAGKTSTAIEIEYRGQRSIPVGLAVVPASPGLFTSNSSGRGQAAVLNQDGTLNSPANPAPRGSVVVFYGTGEGVGMPLVTSGQVAGSVLPKPLLPVSVRIGGAVAEIQYAGAAPGLIAGIIQVNAKVPEDAPAGPAVPLTFTVGSASSPAGVTIAIR